MTSQLRVAIALSGFHRVHRGAENALLAIASELQNQGVDVTLFGGGPRPGTKAEASNQPRYVSLPTRSRVDLEHLPTPRALVPDAMAWEDLLFSAKLLKAFQPGSFDATMTCAYPWTSWALRSASRLRPRTARPAHVFVTENGDWPAFSNDREFRLFSCDGLVCTNPEYFERNAEHWNATLIPNGVDPERFAHSNTLRKRLGLDPTVPVVLMVSAIAANKRVAEGIRAVASLEGVTLVVAGDGPDRTEVDALGSALLGERYHRLTIPLDEMPSLYRSANVVLHLALDESFGNVYIESLASGVPLVGPDLAHTRWIFGEDALLIDTGEISSIASALQRVIDGSWSLPSGAVECCVERFSWESIGRQYREFLVQVVERRRS